MPNVCTNITPICTPKKICSIIIITISTPKNIFFTTPILTPTPKIFYSTTSTPPESESKSGFRTPCISLLTVYELSDLFYLSAILINALRI